MQFYELANNRPMIFFLILQCNINAVLSFYVIDQRSTITALIALKKAVKICLVLVLEHLNYYINITPKMTKLLYIGAVFGSVC